MKQSCNLIVTRDLEEYLAIKPNTVRKNQRLTEDQNKFVIILDVLHGNLTGLVQENR